MGTVNDDRLLKIIYPGGRVELYDRPVAAREIMDRYPKVYIARTDFFRVPWFVVSPEAILMPGMQFLVVPKRTIKRLLKKHTKPLNSTGHDTMNNSTAPKKGPVLKECSNSESKKWPAVQTDQQKENRARLCCLPLSSQSISGFELSPELFVRAAPYFQFSATENVHPLDQASDSYKAAKPNRKVAFILPTAKDIKYYIPSPISPDTDVASTSSVF
ncbi:hypothetical protein SUGI_1186330 [Cryptomeria japonica]|nr:hypothetical protein SUGI_1186330 [Cryptomeria japonica]